MPISPEILIDQAKAAYANKKFEQAADLFQQAAQEYQQVGNDLMFAEMQNNLSVTLLQAGKAQAALDAVAGTEKIFEREKDIKRQAMAYGNQGAALEELKKIDNALAAYQKSAELFGEIDETEMRSMMLQSIATIKLRQGKVMGSAFSMIGSAETTQKPTFWQRILKFLLRFIK